MYIKSNFYEEIKIWFGKLKNKESFEPGKKLRTRSFWGWNWDFLRSFEPEPKNHILIKKRMYTIQSIVQWLTKFFYTDLL